MSMFSSRLPPNPAANALSRRLAALQAEGIPYVDLTESNPTRAGFAYPADLLRGLADARALWYEPHAFGLRSAREAVAADHARRGAAVDPAHVVLTASTSEAYAWLFKLLCSPGERVLVPRPSYPLFEHLTRLEGVEPAPYDIELHGRWTIDARSVANAATADTRAVLVVSPNNPTGSYLTMRELAPLADVCADRHLALVVDEVFADYVLDAPADRVTDVAVNLTGRSGSSGRSSDRSMKDLSNLPDLPGLPVESAPLTFTLGGLSKSVGLPQLKLGWIVAGGDAARRDEALAGLEMIADSYLSVSTPVQLAAPDLLARGTSIRDGILARVRHNLATLCRLVAAVPSCELLPCEGGWYAVVRVPATRTEEERVLALLDRERILVHPGYFFDFPREAYLVVSLLPPPDVFADAAARMLQSTSAAI